MRKALFLISIFSTVVVFGQSLIGAWEWTEVDDEGGTIKGVVTFTKDYQAATWFDAETGAFLRTNGGAWKLEGNTMTEVAEFNSEDPEKIGKEVSFDIGWKVNT